MGKQLTGKDVLKEMRSLEELLSYIDKGLNAVSRNYQEGSTVHSMDFADMIFSQTGIDIPDLLHKCKNVTASKLNLLERKLENAILEE